MRIRKGRKLFGIGIILTVLISSIPMHALAADTATVTYQGCAYSYNASGGRPAENMHGKFTTNFGGGVAYCAEHGNPPPTGETPGASKTLALEAYSNTLIGKILFYGWKGPEQWDGFSSSTYNSVYKLFAGNAASTRAEACGISVTGMALSRIYQNYGGKGRWYDVSGLEAFLNYVNSKPAPPEGFKIYRLNGSGNMQDLFVWEYQSEGYLKLKKVAAYDGSLTAQCPENYSLAGAVYNVYSDSSLTKKAGSFTTDKNGNSETLTLEAGTYWIKEVKASPGFKLDGKVYTVKVNSGQVTTFTGKEEPKFNPLEVILSKTDAGGSGPSPGLAGAEFTVKYYKKLTDDVSGLKPEKTWIFRTDSKGLAAFDDSCKVGGDPLYKNSKGIPTGLIGTYEIFETKAPGGYMLNEEHFIVRVEEGTPGGPSTVYNAPVIPEERKEIRFNVVKEDADLGKPVAQGEATLEGAVFGLYEKDGTLIEKYTTDRNGAFMTDYYAAEYAFENELYLKEITPPDGYLLNGEKFVLDVENPADIAVRYTTVESRVKDEVIKGKIALMKSFDDGDETGIQKPEKDIEFQVYLKSAGSYDEAEEYNRDIIKTGKDGYAETKELPTGTYTVHQMNSTEGRDRISDFEVNISEDGAVYRYILNNASVRADLHVEKVDAETDRAIVTAEAAFKIWNVDEDEWVSFDMHYPHDYVLDEFVTDERGGFCLPEPLRYGNYELHEIKAPEGYVLSEEPIPFKVDGGKEAISIRVENMPQKGTLSLVKTGEILKAWQKNESGTYAPVYVYESLKGAVFQIIAAENIVTGDGTVRAEKGEVVSTVTTDGSGKAKTEALYLGKYIVKEKTAPEGYVLDGREYEAELKYGGQDVEQVNAAVNDGIPVENVLIKGSIEGIKTDETGEPLKGALIGLFSSETEDFTDENALMTAVSDERGRFAFEEIPYGEYIVVEIEPPDGFVLSGEKFPVKIDENGGTVSISIENERITPVPKTGDESRLAFFTVILLSTMIFSGSIAARKRRDRKKN